MTKKMVLSLLCVLLFLLYGCNKSLPDTMPDFGIRNDQLEFNKNISLTAPQECNTFKPGKPICLKVKNQTDKIWDYNILDDVSIYQYKNDEWKVLVDKMTHLGVTKLSLGTRGNSPSETDIVDVTPDIPTDQSVTLRIIIFFHERDQGQAGQTKGAFVDVILKP